MLNNFLKTFLRKKKIVPKCISGYRWMIDSTGQFRPCCWIDPRDFDHPEFNVHKNSIDEIFKTKPFLAFLSSLHSYDTAPEGCKRACGELTLKSAFTYGKKEKYGYAKNMKIFQWKSKKKY